MGTPTTRRPISISNAQRRLEKARALINDVYLRASDAHFDALEEALTAARDFSDNAINRCKRLRGLK